jgi:site-specific recombinase XerD
MGNPHESEPVSRLTVPLGRLTEDFLADLRQANHSPHTLRAYASDLAQFEAFHAGSPDDITVERLRAFWQSVASLSPATRSRKQACLACFLTWAYRHDYIAANPMDKIDRVKREPPEPRGVGREAIERILGAIPAARKRDRLLFRLVFETGLRIGEALELHVEDLELAPDDEHIHVRGKGGKPRTVLLDDPLLVCQLRTFLRTTGYQHAPLFRAEKNGRGGPLRYQSVQERWAAYCRKAGASCTLHQLRHTHATELVNEGVSLTTIRKRLGHKNLQTTLRYAEQTDAAADAEMRAWRRRRQQR